MTDPYYDLNAPESEAVLFSRIAAGYVQDLAPVPDPEPDDYADKAAAAEYLVYNYLTQTKGAIVSSQSARGLSLTLADRKNVEALIAPVMGTYFAGPSSSIGNTAYLEDFA